MTRDEQRAYSRGYQAGIRGRWPEHKPPEPPNEIIAGIMHATSELRDAVDSQLAMFGDDDEINIALNPKFAAFDEAMATVTQWLKSETDAEDVA